jgi:hypothetical protein
MEKSPSHTIRTNSSTIKISCHYPEENPEGTISDVVKTMDHIGLFDGIQNKQPS